MHFVLCIHNGVTLCTLRSVINELPVLNRRGSFTFSSLAEKRTSAILLFLTVVIFELTCKS